MGASGKFVSQDQKDFGKEGAETWRLILHEHNKKRHSQIVDLFHKGVDVLEINENKIPDLNDINKRLKSLTGFEGIFVSGLEDGRNFYKMLAHRQFPIGNFIRDKEDLTYTPEPDVVHDLYGHMPFFVDKDYADFCYQFGEAACKYMDQPEKLRQFERFFWFTIEFGLIETPQGRRVFGAGIASSTGECEYALSDEPEVIPFDIDKIRKQEFRIDEMQKKLFVLKNKEQLYSSLQELEDKIAKD